MMNSQSVRQAVTAVAYFDESGNRVRARNAHLQVDLPVGYLDSRESRSMVNKLASQFVVAHAGDSTLQTATITFLNGTPSINYTLASVNREQDLASHSIRRTNLQASRSTSELATRMLTEKLAASALEYLSRVDHDARSHFLEQAGSLLERLGLQEVSFSILTR